MERDKFKPYTVALGEGSGDEEKLVSSQIESISQKFGDSVEAEDIDPHVLRSDEKFWDSIGETTMHRGARIELQNFSISDWLPRWPGLYVTDRARRAREEADRYIFRDDDPRMRRWRSRNPELYEKYKGMNIYRSGGKQRMLAGGRGCVKLSSYTKPYGEAYLFTAYTGYTPESGVPIEIKQDLHDLIIDEIAQTGCASGITLSGTLRDAPEFFRDSYDRQAKRLILVVDRIRRERARNVPPMISVPISFVDKSTDHEQILVSYASFFASEPDGYEMAVEFLEDVYVKSLYDGRILTDFDETQSNFDDAILSLKKINSGCLSDASVRRSVDRALGGRHWRDELEEASTYIETNIERMAVTVAENYNISKSKNISIKSSNVTQIDQSENFAADSTIADLRAAIEAIKSEISPEDYSELKKNADAVAEEAAKNEPSKDFIDIFVENIARKAKVIGGVADGIIPIIQKIAAFF